MSDVLEPGGTIGILGGGQLGRMLALAAARLGLKCHVFDPAEAGPASDVSAHHTAASFEDESALRSFAESVDVATYEFENVPVEAIDIISESTPVRPGRDALLMSQDRLSEKDFLNSLGIRTAPYRDAASLEDLTSAVADIGAPGILKTRRFGYDGKGQARIAEPGDLAGPWADMAGSPAIYEGFVSFSKEISVIAARSLSGDVAAFDPGENVHEDGILRTTHVPANISPSLRSDAVLIAAKLLNALDYVGVLGLELFVSDKGLIANEYAPRVHNSGHWTQGACTIDQFEQHIRAIAGWPLGPGNRHSDAMMENLIGEDVHAWRDVSMDGLHLYGKADIKPGRKMGHINRIAPLGQGVRGGR